jgi:hypothetical protein
MPDRCEESTVAPVKRDMDTTFTFVAGEWSAIVARAAEESASDRDMRLQRISEEYLALVVAGKWVSGPSDLLSILGRDRDELVHSRVLAWLCEPRARHQLGSRFLRKLITGLWPELAGVALSGVVVDREIDRVTTIGATTYGARADVVVYLDGATLVIENKVDAVEGPIQCERLFRVWRDEPGETRWLLLSPLGRAPASVATPEAAQAWTAVSYRILTAWLAEAIDEAGPGAGLGRESARQYLETLRQRYPAVKGEQGW